MWDNLTQWGKNHSTNLKDGVLNKVYLEYTDYSHKFIYFLCR